MKAAAGALGLLLALGAPLARLCELTCATRGTETAPSEGHCSAAEENDIPAPSPCGDHGEGRSLAAGGTRAAAASIASPALFVSPANRQTLELSLGEILHAAPWMPPSGKSPPDVLVLRL